MNHRDDPQLHLLEWSVLFCSRPTIFIFTYRYHLGNGSGMKPIRLLSAAEQVAEHLRAEILRGAILGEMTGIYRLASGLVTNHKTVNSALLQLEKEGLLVSQGNGRPRKIVLPQTGSHRRSLRVAILKYDAVESMDRYSPELLHSLLHAGHAAFFSGKSLIEMGMNLNRIIDHVKRTDADVWVVSAGSCEGAGIHIQPANAGGTRDMLVLYLTAVTLDRVTVPNT